MQQVDDEGFQSALALLRRLGDVRVERYCSTSESGLHVATDGLEMTLRCQLEEPHFVAFRNAEMLTEGQHGDLVYDAFLSAVEHYLVENSREFVVVHAGVVAIGESVVVLPGKSEAGKTTLTLELVRRGAEYYSDEFALMDPAGRVHPYPRAPSIRSGAQLPPLLDLSTDPPARRVSAVVSTGFTPDAQSIQVRETTPGVGVLELLKNSFAGKTDPARCISTFGAAMSGSRVLVGPRGEAAAFAEWLMWTLS